MPRGRPRIYTPEQRSLNEAVKRYPEYDTEIKQLRGLGYPFDAILETCRLARRHHVQPQFLVEILISMMAQRRASQETADVEYAE